MSEKPRGKRAKLPVDLAARGRGWQGKGPPAPRVRGFGCRRAGGAYIFLAEDGKTEILGYSFRYHVQPLLRAGNERFTNREPSRLRRARR